MALNELTSREAVLRALREFDELGRDRFLAKYGFKRARSYVIEHDGKRYDSKAIAGAAHGFQFGKPLAAADFSGGEATVGRKLAQLGFDVPDLGRDRDLIPKPALAAIVGPGPFTSEEVVERFWAYVSENKLVWDRTRALVPDEKIRALAGSRAKLTLEELRTLVNGHLEHAGKSQNTKVDVVLGRGDLTGSKTTSPQRRTWIFQGSPDTFDLDAYLGSVEDITWTVKQKHLAPEMHIGDVVYVWRARGADRKAEAGVVASAVITETPSVRSDDPAGLPYWQSPADAVKPALRARLRVTRVAGTRQILKRAWMENDPILRQHRIFKLRNETNYELDGDAAARMQALWEHTGEDWTEDESLAGLWAYAETQGTPVSKVAGVIPDVAVRIGRAVTGVYNKVMNFRALDPSDSRAGLDGSSEVDRIVWDRYFDPKKGQLDVLRVAEAYQRVWGSRGKHETETTPPPQGDLGAEYRSANENSASAPRDPFSVDPSVVDRGLRGHATTQNALAEFVKSIGAIPRSPRANEPNYDLAWELSGVVYVAEVKSTTPENEEKQLRLGLGQVLRYRQLLSTGSTRVIGVLAVEREPAASWKGLCATLGILLVWPAVFAATFSSGSTKGASR